MASGNRCRIITAPRSEFARVIRLPAIGQAGIHPDLVLNSCGGQTERPIGDRFGLDGWRLEKRGRQCWILLNFTFKWLVFIGPMRLSEWCGMM